MEGTTMVDNGREIKWSKDSDNKWTIQLVKVEDNPESDGHTLLIKETVLKEMEYTEV
tara:strand:+ start:71 stop:241 length:171 start_codon:yes stop_codon:yes gene_type:complete